MFFGRLDFQDKDTRLKDKTMEMVWLGSANLGMFALDVTSILFSSVVDNQ